MIYGWTYYPSVVRNDYDQCFTLIDCQEGAHLKELRSFRKNILYLILKNFQDMEKEALLLKLIQK